MVEVKAGCLIAQRETARDDESTKGRKAVEVRKRARETLGREEAVVFT